MKILHCFNMANDGWSSVKGLRSIGVDAHLIIHRPAHVASLPQWEEAEIDESMLDNLYDPNWDVLSENWKIPDHVHVWDLKATQLLSKGFKWLRYLSELAEYDVVIGHIPFAKLAPLYKLRYNRPYLIYDAGWIRYLHKHNFRLWFMARIGYRNANRIMFTNVDTHEIFTANGYDSGRLVYSPFAIDMDLYSPRPEKDSTDHSPVFFSPSRQDWPEKRNDMLLRAFKRYLKRQPGALLTLVDWGQSERIGGVNYLAAAKRLVHELAIQDSVKWLPVMPKRKLVRWYNLADVVFDQYVFGALGTTTPEAMACERPVVSHVNPMMWTRWHSSAPPVVEARNEDEIYDQMIRLEDEELRRRYGKEGREWIAHNCEMKRVAQIQLKICTELLHK